MVIIIYVLLVCFLIFCQLYQFKKMGDKISPRLVIGIAIMSSTVILGLILIFIEDEVIENNCPDKKYPTTFLWAMLGTIISLFLACYFGYFVKL